VDIAKRIYRLQFSYLRNSIFPGAIKKRRSINVFQERSLLESRNVILSTRADLLSVTRRQTTRRKPCPIPLSSPTILTPTLERLRSQTLLSFRVSPFFCKLNIEKCCREITPDRYRINSIPEQKMCLLQKFNLAKFKPVQSRNIVRYQASGGRFEILVAGHVMMSRCAASAILHTNSIAGIYTFLSVIDSLGYLKRQMFSCETRLNDES
jgi:hypothetical protein